MTRDEISIDQTLHGYRHGHELLASSLELSSIDKRKMLYLSDVSGSEFTENFDGYLEGYPISGDSYVISRTWKATEMKRPGCVWTHSLIISKQDLNKINSFHDVGTLHRRPGSIEDSLFYRNKITTRLMEDGVPNTDFSSFALVSSFALNQDKQFIVPIRDRVESEKDIEVLWQLLNGEQRYSLSFCCGYLSSSQPAKDSFQLAFIPKTGKRFSWDKATAIYLDGANSLSSAQRLHSDEYLEVLIFLFRELGLSESTSNFADELFNVLSEADISGLRKVAASFEFSRFLAIKLFGPSGVRFNATSRIDEVDLIMAIIIEKNLREIEELKIFERIDRLPYDEKFAVFEELIYINNENDRSLIINLYEGSFSQERIQIRRAPSWLIVYFITNGRPFDISVLRSTPKNEILSVISQSWSENPKATFKYLKETQGLLDLKDVCIWLLLNASESEFGDILFGLNINLGSLSYHDLERLLHKHPRQLIATLSLADVPERLAIDIFAKSIEIKRVDIFFEKLSGLSPHTLKWNDNFWFEIISLCAGYDSPDSNRLFVELYTYVMELFRKNSSWGNRFRLSALLPFGRLFKRFDAPENLRLALVDLFMSKRISAKDLLSCLDTKNEAWEFVDVLNQLKIKERLEFLSALKAFSGTKNEEDKVYFLVDNVYI
ncbi:hypothetical protein ACES2I_17435 [Bdellovibrio bacteriovorus]|uniref:GAP1-N1 domain-containing protein n=1 Tax=Bdellovibrio bacteriovorus TaxID=959 RepID=UPI0035A57B6E